MADLAAHASAAGNHFSIHDHTAANTGAQSDENQRFITLSGAHPELAKRCRIRIVACFHLYFAKETGKKICNIDVRHVKVHQFLHITIFLNRSGHAHADTGKIRTVQFLFAHMLTDTCGNIRENMKSIMFRSGGNLPFIKHSAICSNNSKLYCCTAQIHANTFFHRSLRSYRI